jgi:hypothetical protein
MVAKTQGRTRREQNSGGISPDTELDWEAVQGRSFVPPQPECLMECLDSFEGFLHDEKHKLPVLLCAKGALTEPLLYPSLYLEINRNQYYDLLQRVRTEGAWEDWLAFFLEGGAGAAQEAADTAERTLSLFAKDRDKIQTLEREAPSA